MALVEKVNNWLHWLETAAEESSSDGDNDWFVFGIHLSILISLVYTDTSSLSSNLIHLWAVNYTHIILQLRTHLKPVMIYVSWTSKRSRLTCTSQTLIKRMWLHKDPFPDCPVLWLPTAKQCGSNLSSVDLRRWKTMEASQTDHVLACLGTPLLTLGTEAGWWRSNRVAPRSRLLGHFGNRPFTQSQPLWSHFEHCTWLGRSSIR